MKAPWPIGSYDVLDGLVVVFCGLNPSTEAAATGRNFGSPNNRFWRTLHLAGFAPRRVGSRTTALLRFGCGITAAVGRDTRSAAKVRRSEFAREAAVFERKVVHYGPHVIAFLGKAAYAAMSDRQSLERCWRRETFGGATVWILPNQPCLQP